MSEKFTLSSSNQKRIYTCERQESSEAPYGKPPIIKIRRTQEPPKPLAKPQPTVSKVAGKSKTNSGEADTSTADLEHLLLFYHEQLEKRDPRKFFARPVTDDIAPGYSKIIRRPIDLSTMRQKMRKKRYPTLQDYQSDVRLMCHNAMTYNTPETVYYQKARKMLAYVEKAMVPVKAESIAADLGYAPSRTQLGLGPQEEEEEEEGEEGEAIERDESGTTDGCTDLSPGPPRLSPEGGGFVHFDTEEDLDDASAAAIVIQAKEAAAGACRRLEERYGAGAAPKLAYLTISRPVSAGGIFAHECGPNAPKPGRSVILPPVEEVELFLGSGSVPAWQGEQVWRELEALNSKPREPVAAHLDWVLKGFSEETARHLVSAYGDALAVEYASSLLTFASECGAFPRTLAHKCLNILTEGEHEKVQHLWRRRIPDAIPQVPPVPAPKATLPAAPTRQTATVQPLQRSEPPTT